MGNPITDEIATLVDRASVFNSNQVEQIVRFEEVELRERLEPAFALREEDGRAILDALPDIGLSEPDPTTTYVLLELDEPSAGWVPGAHASLKTSTFASLPSDPRVVFAMTRGASRNQSRHETSDDAMQVAFGLDVNLAPRRSWGVALNGLDELLGHTTRELRFRYE
jgi:hypothetical protein